MAEKAEEDRMERRRLQQQQHQMVSESWKNDDHPPFGLGPCSRRKRNPANNCPPCPDRLHYKFFFKNSSSQRPTF